MKAHKCGLDLLKVSRRAQCTTYLGRSLPTPAPLVFPEACLCAPAPSPYYLGSKEGQSMKAHKCKLDWLNVSRRAQCTTYLGRSLPTPAPLVSPEACLCAPAPSPYSLGSKEGQSMTAHDCGLD